MCPCFSKYENGVNFAPSIAIGSTVAPDLSAMSPGPSYIFIKEPVVVILPSGKITAFLSWERNLTMDFTDKGFAGSMMNKSTNIWLNLEVNLLAIRVLIAKVGVSGNQA